MNKSFWGILLVSLGVLFLISNLGLLPMELNTLLSIYWPIILILLGINHIVKVYLQGDDLFSPSTLYFTTLMIGSGLILLGNRLDWFATPISFWKFFWPMNIIFLGLTILFGSKESTFRIVTMDKNIFINDFDDLEDIPNFDEGINLDEALEDEEDVSPFQEIPKPKAPPKFQEPERAPKFPGNSLFIGSYQQGKKPWVLEDQKTVVAIGDIALDLTKAFVKDGITTLDLTGKIGGIEIVVPSGLPVSIQAEVKVGDIKIFGKSFSGTPGVKYFRSKDYDEAIKKINLRLSVKIGSIVVKQVD